MSTIVKIVIGVILGMLIIGGGLVACSALFVNEVDKELNKEETATLADDGEKKTSSEEKQAEKTTYQVGDTIEMDGIKITIRGAEYISPSEYSAPENGKVMQLTVDVENNSETSAYVSSAEFNLYDSEGNAFEPYYSIEGSDISADLNKGKKTSGTLTYDVKEGSTYELIYEPSFSWTSNEVVWMIEM